ncbi:MBL fold metallo-hydrolase [Derxia gummosa]|uniref:MBL fold metallo-hydrolase n=1 Tax=Derxia gummosa DSM 723 TaxID=1121388 RepID=A0A8B6X3Q1_9BURK|nr:MBL fold metallo-hydrolase [Derxia gummosa]
MRYTSLGSGSEGNALVIEARAATQRPTRILLDCGFGVREVVRRLVARGIEPESLDAILVTHEHGDHGSGVARLARRYGIPVHSSHGTGIALRLPDETGVRWRPICSHTRFEINGLDIRPFPVPHDAREPTQFVFSDGRARLGVLTDVGSATPFILDMLTGCDGLVLECNHDPALLAASSYPPSVRARIAGNYGHLSNSAAAAILAAIERDRLKHLHAAHLSRQNNQPELAAAALAAVLNCNPAEILLASQQDGFDWVEI